MALASAQGVKKSFLSKGGDALSVCFNTIAILFLTEVTPMLKPRKALFRWL